jgi:hypothetical protein
MKVREETEGEKIGKKLREIFKGKSYGEIERIVEAFLCNIKIECTLN